MAGRSFGGISTRSGLNFYELGSNNRTASFTCPSSLAASYSVAVPLTAGSSGQFLQTNGSNQLTWANVSSSAVSHTGLSNLDSGTYTDGGHTYLAQLHSAGAAPTTSNDSSAYKVGTVWTDTSATPKDTYLCVDNTASNAVWHKVLYGGGSVDVKDGLVGTPSITFSSDLDTGLYRIGANNLGVSANGSKVLDIGTTGLGVTGSITTSTNFIASVGAAATPSMYFTGDPDTGLYWIGANNLGVSANGSKVLDIGTTGLGVTGSITTSTNFIASVGAAATPSIYFTGDADTGLYWIGANNFGATVGGNKILDIANTGLLVGASSDTKPLKLQSGIYTVSFDVTSLTDNRIITVPNANVDLGSLPNQSLDTTSSPQFAYLGINQAAGTERLEVTGNIKASGTISTPQIYLDNAAPSFQGMGLSWNVQGGLGRGTFINNRGTIEVVPGGFEWGTYESSTYKEVMRLHPTRMYANYGMGVIDGTITNGQSLFLSAGKSYGVNYESALLGYVYNSGTLVDSYGILALYGSTGAITFNGSNRVGINQVPDATYTFANNGSFLSSLSDGASLSNPPISGYSSIPGLLEIRSDTANSGHTCGLVFTSRYSSAYSWRTVVYSDDKSYRIRDDTAGADRLVIDTSGRVGIGRGPAGLTSTLEVQGTIAGYYHTSVGVYAATFMNAIMATGNSSFLLLGREMGQAYKHAYLAYTYNEGNSGSDSVGLLGMAGGGAAVSWRWTGSVYKVGINQGPGTDALEVAGNIRSTSGDIISEASRVFLQGAEPNQANALFLRWQGGTGKSYIVCANGTGAGEIAMGHYNNSTYKEQFVIGVTGDIRVYNTGGTGGSDIAKFFNASLDTGQSIQFHLGKAIGDSTCVWMQFVNTATPYGAIGMWGNGGNIFWNRAGTVGIGGLPGSDRLSVNGDIACGSLKPTGAYYWQPNQNFYLTATGNSNEWSMDIAPGGYSGINWSIFNATTGQPAVSVGVTNTYHGHVGINQGYDASYVLAVNGAIRTNSSMITSVDGATSYALAISNNTIRGQFCSCYGGGNFFANAIAGDIGIRQEDINSYIRLGCGGGNATINIKNGAVGINTAPTGIDLTTNGAAYIGGDFTAVGSSIILTNLPDNTMLPGYTVKWYFGAVYRDSSTSSIRFKQDITPYENDDMIFNLRPVYFRYKTNLNFLRTGLIAEEVEPLDTLNQLIIRDKDGLAEGIAYDKFIMPLIVSVQNLNKRLISQQTLIDELQSSKVQQQAIIDALLLRIEALENK